VAAYGQPFADSSAIPSLLVSQVAARQRKVVLNGDGGDEVFAGYRRYQLPSLWSRAPRGGVPGLAAAGSLLSAFGSRRGGVGFASRALRGWGMPESERYLAWTVDLLSARDLERMAPGLAAPRVPDGGVGPEARRCSSLREFLWTDTRLILADALLTKMDIATMRHSLEARSPFLDVPLMERTWSLPTAWLGERGRTKPLLRDLAARELPATVAAAPKRGFEVPVARWLEDELQPLFKDTVLASDARIGTVLDAKAMRGFLEAGTFAGNAAQLRWTLLMLELYLRRQWSP
jgi:asparagine synthase (glutamine-hydrolysing)